MVTKINLCKYDKNECPAKPAPSKKDTKHWCKGKVGVQHVVEWLPEPRSSPLSSSNWQDLVCRNCGKHFAFWWEPTSQLGQKGSFPAYDAKCRKKLTFLKFYHPPLDTSYKNTLLY